MSTGDVKTVEKMVLEVLSTVISESGLTLGRFLRPLPIIVDDKPSDDMIKDFKDQGFELRGAFGCTVSGCLTHIRLFAGNIMKHKKADKLQVVRDVLIHEVGHVLGMKTDKEIRDRLGV